MYAPLSDGWTHVCEPARFVVDFPSPPEERHEIRDGETGALALATWKSVSGKRTYFLEYSEFDDVSKSPEEVVAAMRADATKGAHVLEDRPRSGEGWAMEDLLFEIPPGTSGPGQTMTFFAQERIVLSRRQIWMMLTIATTIDDDQAGAQRFLRSLSYDVEARRCNG